MTAAGLPLDEAQRLEELESHHILDTPPEDQFDSLTRLASHIAGTPIALVSLVDEQRQWFKSRVGLRATETPRDVAFCAHAILDPGELFIVNDALEDQRFRENPLVTGDPLIRFYAGAPLTTGSGRALGTLCVIDREPRSLDDWQLDGLRTLARQVIVQLELRAAQREVGAWIDAHGRATDLLRRNEETLQALLDASRSLVVVLSRSGRVTRSNHVAGELLGQRTELADVDLADRLVDPVVREAFRHRLQNADDLVYPIQFEAALTTKSGERRLACTEMPVRGEGGRVELVVIEGTDVTARRSNLAKLTEGLTPPDPPI